MPADWNPAKRRQKDTEATWTKKHGKSYFGFKLSVNVDKKYKVIRKIETETASTHDSQHFDTVFDGGNTRRDVYADRGYPSLKHGRPAQGGRLAQSDSAQGQSGTSRCRSASSGVTSGSPRPVPGSSMSLPPSSRWAGR